MGPGDTGRQDDPQPTAEPGKPEELGPQRPKPRPTALGALVMEALPTPRAREGCLGAGECA